MATYGMSIDSSIYARLNDTSITAFTSDRIYSTDPVEQTNWPFIVYTITAMSPTLCMGKASGNQDYEVKVDVWAKSVAQRIAMGAAVKARLNIYRGGEIQLLRLDGESSEEIGTAEEGEIYHATQTYLVYTQVNATIAATVDSTGIVSTGNNSVTILACGNSIVLDCSGIRVNGNVGFSTAPIPRPALTGDNWGGGSYLEPLVAQIAYGLIQLGLFEDNFA